MNSETRKEQSEESLEMKYLSDVSTNVELIVYIDINMTAPILQEILQPSIY